VPGLGWLTGASDAVARSEQESAAERDRQVWRDLAASAPSVDQLTPETYLESTGDEYGNLLGGPSAMAGLRPSRDQMASLSALRSLYERGGYTQADENMSRALQDSRAQQMGAANRAALQQMQARGMGGSGAELAAQMGAADSMVGANSMNDAQLQMAAMQRAQQALQGWQSGTNTLQEQEMARRQALDSFNQQNMDWRRGRESRNTAYMTRGGEGRARAHQQAYENRAGAAGGLTRYSPYGNRDAELDRAKDRDEGILSAVGEILDF
jgi:hypothetical protein